MIYTGKENNAEFFEKVDMKRKEEGRADTHLVSDYLKVFFKGGEDLNIGNIQEITQAVATSRRNGDLTFEREGYKGEGNHLVWNKDEAKAVLRGVPLATLVEKDKETQAAKFDFYDKDNKVQAEGQHSLTFWPGLE